MPAIQLTRLRLQTAGLAESFANPQAFVRGLHDLLDYYADRTHRPGQSGAPAPLLRPYNVPRPVLRQLETEMVSLAAAEPEAATRLVDALWEQPFLEFHLLAIALLGMLPPAPPEKIYARVQTWAAATSDDSLLDAITGRSLAAVRRADPARCLEVTRAWLSADDPGLQRLGLKALAPLVAEERFDNLPPVFQALNAYVRACPPALQPHLVEALQALVRRSPQETAYYLRQGLELPGKPGAAWLIRKTIDDFPVGIQAGLRTALREATQQAAKKD